MTPEQQKRIEDKLDRLMHVPVSKMTGDELGHVMYAIKADYLAWPLPTEKHADEQERLQDSITWEEMVDGLGMEDFPERDHFMEAGQLLREASEFLKGAVAAYSIIGRTVNARSCQNLAVRIDTLLSGGDS